MSDLQPIPFAALAHIQASVTAARDIPGEQPPETLSRITNLYRAAVLRVQLAGLIESHMAVDVCVYWRMRCPVCGQHTAKDGPCEACGYLVDREDVAHPLEAIVNITQLPLERGPGKVCEG